jgi:hypothetical protein
MGKYSTFVANSAWHQRYREVELDRLDQLDEFRSEGIGTPEATNDWMRELSTLLTAPPAVELLRIADRSSSG